MTVGEYARSLVDQNYSQTEMYDMVLAFKAKQKKEKKTEVVAEQVKNTDSTLQGSERRVRKQYRIRIGKWTITASRA